MLMRRYKVALYIENFDLVGLNNDPSKSFHMSFVELLCHSQRFISSCCFNAVSPPILLLNFYIMRYC